MKKVFKKLVLTAGMVLTVMASTAITSFAAENVNDGTWKRNEIGWWYEFADGSYLTNNWYWIDSNADNVYECYYFDNRGYMAENTVIDGYTVDGNGQWVVEGFIQTQKLAAPDKGFKAVKENKTYIDEVEIPKASGNEIIENKSNYDVKTAKMYIDYLLENVDWSTGTSTFNKTYIDR